MRGDLGSGDRILPYDLSTIFLFSPFPSVPPHFPLCGPYILSFSEALGRDHFFLIGVPSL